MTTSGRDEASAGVNSTDAKVKPVLSDAVSADGAVESSNSTEQPAAQLVVDNVVHVAPGDKKKLKKAATPAAVPAVDPDAPPPPPTWRSRIMRTGSGQIRKTFANCLAALRLHPDWVDSLCYDAFATTIILTKAPPWETQSDPPQPYRARPWTDYDNLRLTEWMQRLGIEIGKAIVADAVFTVAKEKEYHPVRDYLQALKWDGTARLDGWLPSYLRTPDRPYERMVGPKWLISAVARTMQPGCKADCVLILMGTQGQRKSTVLETLIGKMWFTDEIGALAGNKDTQIAMAGKLLVEFSDLEGFHGRTADELKAFLSRTTDRYRAPFARYAEDHPRQVIFAGTTNQQTPLRDFTGNRRFWPVKTGDADVEGIKRDRDQIWAEAVERYRTGTKWWLESKAEAALADNVANEAQEQDPWTDSIVMALVGGQEVRVSELLEETLKIPMQQINRGHQIRVSAILTTIGWERVQKRNGQERYWCYVPKAQST